MGMEDDTTDSSTSRSIQNFVSGANWGPLLRAAQDGKEMGSDDNLVDCVVQSDYPEKLDGRFLTLGVGVSSVAGPTFSASNKKNGTVQFNPSQGQSGYESSISRDFGMAVNVSDQPNAGRISGTEENTVGLSNLRHNFGRLPTIAQNAGELSLASASPGPVQNAGEPSNMIAYAGALQNQGGSSLSEYHLGVPGSFNSNFSLSGLQKLTMPQSHVLHPFLTPHDQKFGAGFAYVDPNLSGASPNSSNISNQSRVPPNQGIYGLSGLPPIVHNSSKTGLPAQLQHRVATLPSVASNMTNNYATLAADQLQKGYQGGVPNFLWGTSMASPVLGDVKRTGNWYQPDQAFAHDQGASQVSSSIPFLNNFGVQTAGQVIPPTRGTGPPMISNLAGPSLKRKAAQIPLATPPVQMKRTRSVNPSSSALNKEQNDLSVAPIQPVVSQPAPVPSIAPPTSSVPPVNRALSVAPIQQVVSQPAPVPSLAPPTSSVPPVNRARRVVRRIRKVPPSSSQATPVCPPPSLASLVPRTARMSPALHIRWKDSEPVELSGHNCLLCKRDLSYTPEGPVSQPSVAPHVAVLPCGHCFHDLCLQKITPEDQADNPPCIPCAVGEG